MSQTAAAIPTRTNQTKCMGAVFGVLIVLLGVLDVISTNLVIAAGGSELNPIVAWFMESLDSWWHVPKLALHVIAGLLVFHALKSRLAVGCAIALIIFYGIVVQNNFMQFLSA